MPNDKREQHLHALAQDLVFPPTPDFDIRAALPRDNRRLSLLSGLASLCLALVLVLTPPVRAGIQQLFDAVGIEIQIAERENSEPTATLLDKSLFGQPVSAGEAREAFGQELLVPAAMPSSDPDAIYLYQQGGLISVTFAWMADDDLPALGESNIGVIFTQTTSSPDHPYLVKSVSPEGSYEHVDLESGFGWWIEGGEISAGDYRRGSANVLIWLSADVRHAYRLESMLDRETSIAMANDLVPWNPSTSTPVLVDDGWNAYGRSSHEQTQGTGGNSRSTPGT